MSTPPPINPVDAYALDVVNGAVPAGKYHRLSCQRHLTDHGREGTPGFPFRFVWAHADRFLRFARRMRHYKGRQFAGQYFDPTPVQVFRLGSVFGWRHATTGYRRFTTAYNEVPRKQGKALAVGTPVPTPDGWKQHGDLRPGDFVLGPDGRPKLVKWNSGWHVGPAYRLRLECGAEFYAHENHEWVTRRSWYTNRPKGSRQPLPPVETKRIAETLRGGARGDFVHRIDVAAPLELPEADLPIPPYTLGAWLGDGTCANGSITFADPEIADRIRAEGVECVARSKKGAATLYRLDGRQGSRHSMTGRLRALGVLENKHIPMAYLRASKRQRLELLRGLVDTDGYCGPKGQYEFVSMSSTLADDVAELVMTLGMKVRRTEDRARLNGQDYGPRYRLRFSPNGDAVATVPRKITTWATTRRRRSLGRTIVACDPTGPETVNCIEVEGGVYLVGPEFVPTHNSFEEAIVAVYCTFFEGEAGAEGYCIATKEKQAKIAFDAAKKLVKSSGLADRIRINSNNLNRAATESKLEPLGSDSDTTDGLSPHFVGVDELHAFKHRGLLDVMESATGSRVNPMNFQITTAGDNLVSPCGDQHLYACQILDGVLDDDPSTLAFFAFIAHADDDDDPWAESTWKKANPHWGISVEPEDMRRLAAKAMKMPSAAAEFKQKRLNLWVNASAPCLSLEGWRAGQSKGWKPALDVPDLRDEPCYIGIDLASKIDLCAVSLVFPPNPPVRPRWRWLQHIWTPEGTLDVRAHRDRAPYRVWANQGWLQTTPGVKIDQRVIIDLVLAAMDLYDVQLIGYDEWHADKLVDDLAVEIDDVDRAEDERLLVPVSQTFKGMSSACLRVQADILAGEIDAGGCPVTAWSVGNVVPNIDGKDNLMFAKGKSRGRIDPVIAGTIATACYLRQPPPAPEVAYQAIVVGGRR